MLSRWFRDSVLPFQMLPLRLRLPVERLALKAIVIGCGLIGSDYGRLSHAGAYHTSKDVELIGGVDIDPKRRETFEARWNVPAYRTLDDAFEAGPVPDVASICTPPSIRVGKVTRLCNAGVKAIWCEKPFAEKVHEGVAMVRRCNAADVALQVNFQRRFDPLHQRAKAVDLGKRVHFDCRFSGDWLRVGCHAIDLYRWFIGEPDHISRQGQSVSFITKRCTGLLTQVDGGKRTTIFDVDLVSPKGRISLAAMGQQMFWGTTEHSLFFPGVHDQRLQPAGADGLRTALDWGLVSLLDHLENGTPLLCTGEDGLAALRIHEAIA
jgi:predicted dehydrogenase